VPRRDRILPKEVRWRGSKCVSRVLDPLVPDGAAPRTQDSHPSTLNGLGAHNERFNWGFPLDATPLGGDHLTSGLSTPTTRAPSVRGVTGRVLAPRRAPPDARHTTWVDDAVCAAICHPLGGHRHNEWSEHANHARAERGGRDWAGLRTTYSPSSPPGVHVLRP